MAWLWWLLAPVATTVAGALIVWWRGRRPSGGSYAELLRALAVGHRNEVPPVNMRVLPAPADGVSAVDG